MAKKQTEEVKETEVKVKVSKRAARKAEIAAEKEKYEVIIDKLIDEKYEAKKNKDKNKVKELNAKIKEAKKERSLVGSTDTFGGQVRAEMRLVRWPSAKEVTKYTIAVLVFVLFFAGFFFLINFLFSLITGLKG
jgi:preprotein translocase SecE subunit